MGIDDRGHTGISGADLRCRVPAVAKRLAPLRRALGAWARFHDMSVDQAADLTLASYEAMANVVEHAYRAQVGVLDVRATCVTDQVTVTVTDYGCWRAPDQLPDRRSGRGLLLIRALAGVAVITSTVDGTIVRMSWPQGLPAS